MQARMPGQLNLPALINAYRPGFERGVALSRVWCTMDDLMTLTHDDELQGLPLQLDNLPHSEATRVLDLQEGAGGAVPPVLRQWAVALLPAIQFVLADHAAHGVRGGLAPGVVESSLRHLHGVRKTPVQSTSRCALCSSPSCTSRIKCFNTFRGTHGPESNGQWESLNVFSLSFTE